MNTGMKYFGTKQQHQALSATLQDISQIITSEGAPKLAHKRGSENKSVSKHSQTQSLTATQN